VVLGDTGNVVIVSTVEVEAPLERLIGEAGLNENVTPGKKGPEQMKATLLKTLLSGVIVTLVDPLCPAVMVKFGTSVPIVKSGMVTLITTCAVAGA
jgi:hypothetical protein